MELKLVFILIAVILSAFVFPITISLFKFSRNRTNVFNFLGEDIAEQLKKLDDFKPRFVSAIEKMESTEEFQPLLFNIDSLHGYIDWKTEKWLIPSELTSLIIKFYNDVFAVESYINIIGIDKTYGKLDRERQINVHKALLVYIEKNIASGKELEEKLTAFRKKGWLLTFFD